MKAVHADIETVFIMGVKNYVDAAMIAGILQIIVTALFRYGSTPLPKPHN